MLRVLGTAPIIDPQPATGPFSQWLKRACETALLALQVWQDKRSACDVRLLTRVCPRRSVLAAAGVVLTMAYLGLACL